MANLLKRNEILFSYHKKYLHVDWCRISLWLQSPIECLISMRNKRDYRSQCILHSLPLEIRRKENVFVEKTIHISYIYEFNFFSIVNDTLLLQEKIVSVLIYAKVKFVLTLCSPFSIMHCFCIATTASEIWLLTYFHIIFSEEKWWGNLAPFFRTSFDTDYLLNFIPVSCHVITWRFTLDFVYDKVTAWEAHINDTFSRSLHLNAKQDRLNYKETK